MMYQNGRHIDTIIAAFFLALAAAIVIVAVVGKIRGIG
jgi:hypothetical protein